MQLIGKRHKRKDQLFQRIPYADLYGLGSMENDERKTGCNAGIITGTCINITDLINSMNRLCKFGHNDIKGQRSSRDYP